MRGSFANSRDQSICAAGLVGIVRLKWTYGMLFHLSFTRQETAGEYRNVGAEVRNWIAKVKKRSAFRALQSRQMHNVPASISASASLHRDFSPCRAPEHIGCCVVGSKTSIRQLAESASITSP